MLYTEFIEGTGCKENDYNYSVYRNLEILYMNSDMTKAEIYEYGKKLVDNSKSSKELAEELKLKEEIKQFKEEIKRLKEEIVHYTALWTEEEDTIWKKEWKHQIIWRKDEIKYYRNKIRELNFILGGA